MGPSYSLEDIPDFSELKGHLGIIQAHTPEDQKEWLTCLRLIHCGLELGFRAPSRIQVHASVILLLGSRREMLETVQEKA